MGFGNGFDDPFYYKKQRLLHQEKKFSHRTKPTVPKLGQLQQSISYHASQLGGLIAGGTALKFFSPNWRTSDVDIITKKNRLLFAKQLVTRLRQEYGDNFRIITSKKAVRVFDVRSRKYIADVVNYPFNEKDVATINDYKVLKPSHVYAGKVQSSYEKSLALKNKISNMLRF